jgi:putative tryptophan/tyrosine transport system substrate-binding protein
MQKMRFVRVLDFVVGNQKSKIQNRKWVGFFAIVVALTVCGARTQAQQQAKVPRIGYLVPSSRSPIAARTDAFRQSLRELGYIEGKTILIEYRYAEGNRERLPSLAAELVRLNVDIIVAVGGDPLIRAARNATKTIPIVMTGAGTDPVAAGFVESLAHPGGNTTGLTNLPTDLAGKRLELLKEAAPKVVRVAALYDPANPPNVLEAKELLPVAGRGLKLSIHPWEFRAADQLEKVFAGLSKQRSDALYIPGGLVMSANRERIASFALRSRLPSVYNGRGFVDAGGLMSYGANPADSDRRVVTYVDRILKGAKPADLPVEQPTKFELVVNLKTAKQIGVTIPQSVLARAHRVIK